MRRDALKDKRNSCSLLTNMKQVEKMTRPVVRLKEEINDEARLGVDEECTGISMDGVRSRRMDSSIGTSKSILPHSLLSNWSRSSP